MMLFLAVVGIWGVWLRPQVLGGPTTIVVVSGTSMEPGLHTGDLVLVHRQDAYRVGDVAAYRLPAGQVGAGSVVIHRIVGGSAETGFVLRGDNRQTNDQWRPKPGDMVGREWVAVSTRGPILGFVLSPLGFACLAALFAFVLIAAGGRSEPEPG